MDCLFCQIAAKKIPAETIYYENSGAMAFLDIHPVAPGHTLVIPKVHADNILDLDDQIIPLVFGAVQEAVKILKKAVNPDGFTIGINHGRAAGQAINHFHIHILPRFDGDNGGSIHTVVKNLNGPEPEKIIKKIRALN